MKIQFLALALGIALAACSTDKSTQMIFDPPTDGKPNEMHFDSFSVLENVVKGIGKDVVGYFSLAGVRDDTYISFRKIYLLHKDKYYV